MSKKIYSRRKSWEQKDPAMALRPNFVKTEHQIFFYRLPALLCTDSCVFILQLATNLLLPWKPTKIVLHHHFQINCGLKLLCLFGVVLVLSPSIFVKWSSKSAFRVSMVTPCVLQVTSIFNVTLGP